MERTVLVILFTLLISWAPIAHPQSIIRDHDSQTLRLNSKCTSFPMAMAPGNSFPALEPNDKASPELDSVNHERVGSRFAVRLSAGLGSVTTRKLADALAGYKGGEFEQANVSAYGGIGLQVDLSASVQLSFVVDYSSAEFLFYPDRAGSPSSKAAWDVSEVPITIFICYSPPFMFGPIRSFVGIGGSYIVSTIELTSNYATGSTFEGPYSSPTFGGIKKRDNGWGVDFNVAFVTELTRHVRAGLRGNYMVTTINHDLIMMDQEHGTMTVGMDIRGMSLTLGFDFFI